MWNHHATGFLSIMAMPPTFETFGLKVDVDPKMREFKSEKKNTIIDDNFRYLLFSAIWMTRFPRCHEVLTLSGSVFWSGQTTSKVLGPYGTNWENYPKFKLGGVYIDPYIDPPPI